MCPLGGHCVNCLACILVSCDCIKLCWRWVAFTLATLQNEEYFADGHTMSNAPDLFPPPKLSGIEPG